ncbi:MAG: enoyl-CoA hydratase/isomerase family protein [Candidatus Firestonebacteria bacterium]|nr:enoyl-CoA hydratase/isomerase family protein [Candidatus Firestonebacteria bacterium]
MGSAFKLIKESDGIYYIVFDILDKKVNVLNPLILLELEQIIIELANDKNMKGLIFISGKENSFIAGADISVIYNIKSLSEGIQLADQGKKILRRLDELEVPTVAAINGVCLGGGLELALFCTYRVATDNPATKLGLPEVTLGILPGFGGTKTLPRLIGVTQSLDLILSGKIIDAKKAFKIGIVDKIVPQNLLFEYAKNFMNEILTQEGYEKIINVRRIKACGVSWLENNNIGRSIIFTEARKKIIQKTGGNYPAPLRAIAVIRSGIGILGDSAFNHESEALGELAITPVCKNLIDIYFWSEKAKKSFEKEKVKKINTVGVLGAGVMGGGIAQLLSSKKIQTRIKDIKKDAILLGLRSAWKVYEGSIIRKKIKLDDAQKSMMYISPTLNYSGFDKADMVIEAVVEDLEIKKKVFAELEEHINEKTIIATNTSSLSITKMSSALKHPERFIGFHFFNPVHLMPLVEIIPGERTNDEIVHTAISFALSLGKTPVVVKDKEGFLVNRILIPYLNEAGKLLDDGVSIETIDHCAKKFGLPMGPLELMDEIGIDVGHKVSAIMENAFGPRMKVADSLQKIFEDKRFGKKIGKGFYIYNGKEKTPDQNYANHLRKNRMVLNNSEVLNRMIFIMINEAVRVLEENIVIAHDQVDMGMILGTGFPAFRGGVLKYADTIGIDKIYEELKKLESKFGPRFAPCEKIKAMAQGKLKFY